ncbi:MAG: DUF4982 domain-containing protein, partial [Clostridiales bacterium]|nr:DUF4982 domain-containing protein [Clostridiales bacterium]
YGGYGAPTAATFTKSLPYLSKAEWVVLEVEDVCAFADIYVNDAFVAHAEGEGKHFIDITEFYTFASHNTLAIKVWAPQMAGRYTGAGVGGGVRLHTHGASAAIAEDGVFVLSEVENDRAHLRIYTDICDKSGEYARTKQTLVADISLYNARGKRAAHKIKKFKLKGDWVNTYETSFRLSRFYMWTPSDPYMYTVKVVLKDEGGKVLDESAAPFGIVSRKLSLARGLVLGGRSVKLKGAVMPRDNGILGMESTPSSEAYKLSKIKEIGYNAVRYVGCPTEAALDTLDRLGLMAEVDLFRTWERGAFPNDGHVRFPASCVDDTARFVRQLRKHPSVVLYGLDDNADETYGRGDGSAIASLLAAAVRENDPSRPIVVNAREQVPVKSELERAGLKSAKATDDASAISMGREKDLFGTLTASSFAEGDVAGYAYLYPRYASDRSDYPDRLIVGTACYPSRMFDAFEECEKNNNVIGEFVMLGADGIGYPYGCEDKEDGFVPSYISQCGDLDITYARKPLADYHSIVLGNRSVSAIAVSDPDEPQPDTANHAVKAVSKVWNWPHNLGKTLCVEVYSGGEVVALYRDGKLIGRKLAGKVNKHIATFKADYYPGKLEAVSFHKGRECSRTVLESVGSPRMVKLKCDKKSGNVGDLLFVEIEVADKEGRLVSFASREVEVLVSGAGKLVALGSADPAAKTYESGITKVYEGKALAVIECTDGDDGKIAVKAVSDGLLAGKIALRAKPIKG